MWSLSVQIRAAEDYDDESPRRLGKKKHGLIVLVTRCCSAVISQPASQPARSKVMKRCEKRVVRCGELFNSHGAMTRFRLGPSFRL